jgi:RNA polymerase sigma-70 factor, ECF subfamily
VQVTGSDDRQARFRAMFDAHYDRVYAYAARRSDASTGEDVAATVVALAWQKLDTIDPALELPWLLTTARRVLSTTARGEVRRQARERAAGAPDEDLGLDIAHQVVERAAINDALTALPEADRELLLLCLWDDLSPADAARVLGITATTARVRLHRARSRFRQAYGARAEAPKAGVTTEPIGGLV